MNIEIGKYYKNKTWRFLLPCLRGHGSTFVNKFNPIYKLAVGIHDTLLDGSELSNGKNIFIMCDKKYQERSFNSFLDWIQYQPFYKTDYCPDVDIMKSRKHIIVVSVPEEFEDTYDSFLKAEYSRMFTKEQLSYLFSSPVRKDDLSILERSSKAIPTFVDKINKEFTTNVTEESLMGAELEFPLKRCEEIFNCEENQRVYFNEKLDKIWQ